MFRIRRVFDDTLPIDRKAVSEVQEMLRAQFPQIRAEDIKSLPRKLREPQDFTFLYYLFVAEDELGRLRGFGLMSVEPKLKFGFLDYVAAGKRLTGGGVGGALYSRARDECIVRDVHALFLECLPDDPAQCESAEILRANIARLKFYETFNARPIANCEYHRPIKPGDRGFPYLVVDVLGRERPLRRDFVRRAVRNILEQKYAHLCPPAYIDRVVASFRDDPIRPRPPRYVKQEASPAEVPVFPRAERIAMVVTDQHEIHHVRERGYVEAPVRISVIKQALLSAGFMEAVPPRTYPDKYIRTVHDSDFVNYLRAVCQNVPEGRSVYPYVFPVRNAARPPKDLAIRAGYYCIDTFTPLNRNAYSAAKRAVDCALTAADLLLAGRRVAYALVRPPGHHAERRTFGGFCYFNNCAVAAEYLSRSGRVALLDVDYHHGNGQQVIFYNRADVLTVSLHGHPQFAYPYFSGFREEIGEGSGRGCNMNIPLPEDLNGDGYLTALRRAAHRIARFKPAFLVVALGLDPAKDDPTGSWSLVARDFERNGRLIGSLKLPTLVVQEGGYRTRTLGINARSFFQGLYAAVYGYAPPKNSRPAVAAHADPVPVQG